MLQIHNYKKRYAEQFTVIFILCAVLMFAGSFRVSASTASLQDNYLYAVRLINMEKYETAIAELKNIMNRTSNPVWVSSSLYLLGKCYYELGNYKEAKVFLDRVQKNYPNSKFINFVKDLLNEIARKTPAESNLSNEEIIEKVKQSVEAEQKKNIVVDYKDNVITVENKSQTALNEESLNKIRGIEMLVKEGNDYFAVNDFHKSLDAYQRAYAIDRDNTIVKFNLAVAHLRLENFADANYFFEDVYKRNPEDKEALKYVAFTYMKLNKPALSLAYWNRLLRIAPDDQAARQNIKDLEKLVK